MNLVKRIAFIFIITLLLFSIGPTYNGYTQTKKNPNLDKAKQFIAERKFNQATQILMEELVNDDSNEELIMELLEEIEKEKDKILSLISRIKENIETGDFDEANEILLQLETKGDYDKTINNLIDTLEAEQAPLEDVRTFNDLVRNAEKYLVEYRIRDALDNYNAALDIYRNTPLGIIDEDITLPIDDFSRYERRLLNSDLLDEREQYIADINEFKTAKRTLLAKIKKWLQLEKDFQKIYDKLETYDQRVKDKVLHKAYFSITTKYISLIRRGIQKYSIDLITQFFIIVDNVYHNVDRNDNTSLNEVEQILGSIDEIEYYAFYKVLMDFKNEKFMNRSKSNILAYMDYLSNKNLRIIRVQEAKTSNNLNILKEELEAYYKNKEDKLLYDARDNITRSEELLVPFLKSLDDFQTIIKPYENFKQANYIQVINSYYMFRTEREAIEKNIKQEIVDVKNSISFSNGILKEADKLYAESINLFNRRLFEQSMERFEEAKKRYLKVSTVLQSEYVNKQLEKINNFLSNIEDIALEIDMKLAEEHLEKAKTYFYAEEYNPAKTEIFEADKIYNKYDQTSDEITIFKDRILSAIKIQTGSILSIDDQLYEEITELYNSALFFYNQGNFTKAMEFINLILLEKPYYKKAKVFEIKILRETDKENFYKIYNDEFGRADAMFKSKLFEQALQAYTQLLEYELNVKKINSLIYQCKLQLNLIKPPITNADKSYARRLVSEANILYGQKKYQEALDKVNLAIKRWDNVPGARDLRLACRQRLKIKRPKLTPRNQQLLFEASEAYADGDYDKAYSLTNEILKSQKFDEVLKLNKKAKLKRKK